MFKIKTFLILFFICCISYSQEQLKLYKSIYETSDSLKKVNKILEIDKTVFKEAKKLDQEHPSKYLEIAGTYIAKSKFNEASFFYFLGVMRYQYYNKASQNYRASSDGALLGSLSYTTSQSILPYLKTDINNYISILKMTIHYYKKNDYLFFSKSNNIEKYNHELNLILEQKTNLENNKTKYTNLWDLEIKKQRTALKI
ncbi:hypothetical protein B0A81_19685 [Flavobacterium plurextorum]|uniref:Uncharacterized protein n=1 Tax=Flavobacterium plurextorum TaxID=1114867 RepID=A0ABX4CQL0_9FLAO|nr:hypothetical protein [Flavobacterium plurextorum]OXB01667.1 hypothetical protein B0A81_19685 [Flavobacterium plurextorum]